MSSEKTDKTHRVYAFGALNARLNDDFDKLPRFSYKIML